jgi:hypothetical protein
MDKRMQLLTGYTADTAACLYHLSLEMRKRQQIDIREAYIFSCAYDPMLYMVSQAPK